MVVNAKFLVFCHEYICQKMKFVAGKITNYFKFFKTLSHIRKMFEYEDFLQCFLQIFLGSYIQLSLPIAYLYQ